MIEDRGGDGRAAAAQRGARRVADPASARIAATRARLLDAAEELFLASGYDDVSVRTINAAAGLNPGAVHYHFGSKQGLVVALVEDRMLPRWHDKLRVRFDRLAEAEGTTVHDVVALAVDALLGLAAKPGPGRLHVRLLARAVLGRWDVTWSSEPFSIDHWTRLIARAVPGVPRQVLRERWQLAIALMLERIGRPFDDDLSAAPDVDRDELVQFIAAGLAAPRPGSPRSSSTRRRTR
ncbi:MAG TPA: TetR family transcriptional regulator [Acidimicrobiales bacterium]